MTLTEVQATTDVEQRVRRLEDAEEIRQLKALYGGYWDAGWSGARSDGEKLAELFTEDGVWDGGPLSPVLHGRQEIREYCEWLGRYVTYAIQLEGIRKRLVNASMPER